MTLIDASAPGREMVKVGKADGARRIWICSGDGMGKDMAVGLHRHGGDEIFQVFSGVVRFHVDGRNIDVGAGHVVVVPPYTEHGFKILTENARMEFIGEIEMGEWATVLDPDGSRRQVEVRSEMMPWHRRPLEGEVFDFANMLTMLNSTVHLLDEEPSQEDRHHVEEG